MTAACCSALAAATSLGLDALETFAHGLDHPEGIAVAADGALYAGGEAGQVYRIVGDDVTEVTSSGGSVLGLAFDGEGRLYVCDQARHAVIRVDLAEGTEEVFADGRDGRRMRVPNWGAFDGEGRYFVSDSGRWGARDGLVWCVVPGRGATVWSLEAASFPNGLAVALDGSRLYLVESFPACLVEIPIRADGSAGERQVLCDLGAIVPDGVTIADDGSLVIACYRPDAILRWHPADALDVIALDPRGAVLAAPTNVAFAGERRHTLVVPNVGARHLARGDVGLRGVPPFLPTAAQLEG
jgi:gluconolactonase